MFNLLILIFLCIVLICIIIKTIFTHRKNNKTTNISLIQFANSISENSNKIKNNREYSEIKNKNMIKNMTIMLGGKTDEFDRHNH